MTPCDSCPVPPGDYCFGAVQPRLCDDVAAGVPGRADQLVRFSRPPDTDTDTDPPADRAHAEATCRACDRLDPQLNFCLACHCAGAAWHRPSCPLGKW